VLFAAAHGRKSICNKSGEVGEWKEYSVKFYVLSVAWETRMGTRAQGKRFKAQGVEQYKQRYTSKNRGFMMSDYPLFDHSLPLDHSRFSIYLSSLGGGLSSLGGGDFRFSLFRIFPLLP
jgi:hypothetical protein